MEDSLVVAAVVAVDVVVAAVDVVVAAVGVVVAAVDVVAAAVVVADEGAAVEGLKAVVVQGDVVVEALSNINNFYKTYLLIRFFFSKFL